jgi:hypothetical protein
MHTSSHLSFDQLTDMVQNRLSPAQQAQAQDHIASCQQCLGALARVRQVVGLMRDYDAVDAPEHVIAHAVPLLRQRGAAARGTHEAARPSLPQRIIAALRFDGMQQPAPALRAGRPAMRQLLFDAGQYDVDLRIAPSGSAWAISGQVLGPHTSGQVELHGPAEVVQTELSELSRFRLPPIPAGRYTLTLRLDAAEVEIADLEVGS